MTTAQEIMAKKAGVVDKAYNYAADKIDAVKETFGGVKKSVRKATAGPAPEAKKAITAKGNAERAKYEANQRAKRKK